MGNHTNGANTSQRRLKRRFTSRLNGSQILNLTEDDGFARYNTKELTLLDRMFQDLAKRSPDETMSKETFLQYFALPGILGERLFAVFDKKKDGVIHFDEFVSGLARYNRGSLQEKIEMLFEMYDMDGKQQVNPEELSLILYSVITPTTSLFYSSGDNERGLRQDKDTNRITHVSKVTQQTVEKMVKDAFDFCDTNKDGLLSQEQFTNWVRQNPGALQLLETVFAKHIWSGWDTPEQGPLSSKAADRMHAIQESGGSHRRSSVNDLHLEPEDGDEKKDVHHLFAASNPDAVQSASELLRNRSVNTRLDSSSPVFASQRASGAPMEFDVPTQSIPTHFQALYDKLTQIYLDEGDEHEVFWCKECRSKYYTSIHVEEPVDKENDALNTYDQFVIFKKQSFSSNGSAKPAPSPRSRERVKLKFCPQCGAMLSKKTATSLSLPRSLVSLSTAAITLPSTSTSNLKSVQQRGTLWKIGSKLKNFIARYYVIREKFLYTFKRENDEFPINVMFIAGWFIDAVDDHHRDKGWYGVELMPPNSDVLDSDDESTRISNRAKGKVLYAKSAAERDEWVGALQVAARTISIRRHYEIGRTLGKGHFSVVHLGTHRETGKQCAVKIVEKSRIDAREKMSLRNEIAMMRLVDHPVIIRMLDVFEDQKCIYMVMQLAEFGDFFARWKSKKLFQEDVASKIIWKLLDATQYLHALGIVHRDLKPENILCLDEHDDTAIVISDFGLSKFAAPHTEMTMPCGTLAYVAPEVLAMKGYGRKVDLWSLGCIMHLLLRGVLPFDGHTKDEVVEKTLNKKLNLTHKKWDRVSEDAKDLIAKLLVKDPEQRITLDDALKHRWFDKLKTTMNDDNDLRLHSKISPTIQAVMSHDDKDHDDDVPPMSDHEHADHGNDFELVDKLKANDADKAAVQEEQ